MKKLKREEEFGIKFFKKTMSWEMNVKKANYPRKIKKTIEEKEILPPPRVISHELYFPRFGTKKDVTPPSPFILIDGKLLRSSISFCKKKNNRRVKFPENDILVTAYFESVNPWDYSRFNFLFFIIKNLFF